MSAMMYRQDYDELYPAQDHLFIEPCKPPPFWLDAAYGVSILRDSVRSIFRYNYRSLSDWRLYKIEQLLH